MQGACARSRDAGPRLSGKEGRPPDQGGPHGADVSMHGSPRSGDENDDGRCDTLQDTRHVLLQFLSDLCQPVSQIAYRWFTVGLHNHDFRTQRRKNLHDLLKRKTGRLFSGGPTAPLLWSAVRHDRPVAQAPLPVLSTVLVLQFGLLARDFQECVVHLDQAAISLTVLKQIVSMTHPPPLLHFDKFAGPMASTGCA